MGTPWIDFTVVRQRASFSTILSYYGIRHRGTHGQVSVRCPFHEDTRPSLSVSLARNVFYCHACKAKGDVLDFVARMENVGVPQATAIIAEACGIPMHGRRPPSFPSERAANSRPAENPLDVCKVGAPSIIRPRLQYRHPYLDARGMTPALIETFGLGFCPKGYFRKRVCIGLHGPDGAFLGYAGRWASDNVPDGVPKYLLPRGFKKNANLFNYHRVAGLKHLIVAEGYWTVIRLYALGLPAVGLMGTSLSDQQEDLLIGSGARLLTLLLDPDEAGQMATKNLLTRLSRNFFVRVAELPDGLQPDTAPEDTLSDAVSLSYRI